MNRLTFICFEWRAPIGQEPCLFMQLTAKLAEEASKFKEPYLVWRKQPEVEYHYPSDTTPYCTLYTRFAYIEQSKVTPSEVGHEANRAYIEINEDGTLFTLD